jgi:hypothetical protein
MTMVANGFGFHETPDSLNDKFIKAGGFQGALVIPGAFPAALPGIRYKNYQIRENNPTLMVDIDNALAIGNPVIGMVDYSPAPGIQNHWILILGKKGNDYVIQDPYPYPVETKELLLTKRYGFTGSPQRIIQAALWLEGTVKPQPKPKPVPASAVVVYAIEDALALRSEPITVDSTLIKRVPLYNQFYTIEDATAAKTKIGKQNQWLKVMDVVDGTEGYVAAWFVSMDKTAQPSDAGETGTPQPVKPSPVIPLPEEDPETTMSVFAAADGLALRSEPVVLDTTLIKRLPVNSQFLVLETAIQAVAKLGVFNQWLHVKDATGVKGYVAAWFVTQKQQEPLGVVDQVVFALPTQPLIGKSPVARKKSTLGGKKSSPVSKQPTSVSNKTPSTSKKSASKGTKSKPMSKKPKPVNKKSPLGRIKSPPSLKE